MFDWTLQEMGPAKMISTGTDAGIGGHITELGHEPHTYTIFYVEVEDADDYLKKAQGLGGKTIVPPVPIPTGRVAWLADPEGNTVGLFEKMRISDSQ